MSGLRDDLPGAWRGDPEVPLVADASVDGDFFLGLVINLPAALLLWGVIFLGVRAVL